MRRGAWRSKLSLSWQGHQIMVGRTAFRKWRFQKILKVSVKTVKCHKCLKVLSVQRVQEAHWFETRVNAWQLRSASLVSAKRSKAGTECSEAQWNSAIKSFTDCAKKTRMAWHLWDLVLFFALIFWAQFFVLSFLTADQMVALDASWQMTHVKKTALRTKKSTTQKSPSSLSLYARNLTAFHQLFTGGLH